MELSPETKASYIAIIDSILARSDLTTISEKRIRKGLQEITGDDLAPYKSTLKELIMERFDMFAEQSNVAATTEPVATAAPQPIIANGHSSSSPPHKRSAGPGDVSEIPDSSPPSVKKRKDEAIDSDAAFAAKLQAEENLRARTTRGANSRKTGVTKKKRKSTAKTAKRVKASDDSDVDGSGVEKKEVNRNSGFHKPMALSPALSALLGGQVTLSRPQTVKKVWEYIRENSLQDPADRRQILCDGLMRPIFKQDRIHMFTMTKVLNQNLYDPEE